VLWRKCKTILKIPTRCDEDLWNKAQLTHVRPPINRAVNLYLQELCRAHLQVVNRLVQAYRLATYDYFAFEGVAPLGCGLAGPCLCHPRLGPTLAENPLENAGLKHVLQS
jgi:hypothetical protein